jgi:DNA-binding SARP family transcriptional activator/ABC-type transport system substrate-binding protein
MVRLGCYSDLEIPLQKCLGRGMEFLVLGPVEVRIDGRPLELGGPKQRALLALLLLDANAVVSRDRLVDALWSELAPPNAQRSLDSYVSRLRSLLGANRIERRPPGYRLRVEPGELDLARFEELLKQGRAAAGDPAAAGELLTEALALWRGHALADLQEESLLVAEAERLEERRLRALEAHIDAELELGAGGELVAELERLVAAQPFRERLLGQLMVALYRDGRQADALAAYRAGRRRLAAELGLEPGPELRALERRILEQDTALGALPRPPETPRRRRSRARATAVGVALAAVVASAVVGVELGTRGSSATTARGSTTGVFELTAHSPVAGASLADAPTAMVADASSIWLAEPSAGEVVRVAFSSRQIEEKVPLDGSPSVSALAFGSGSVWAAAVPGHTVYRIDQATERVTDQIVLPGDGSVGALAYGFGRLWVADSHDQELLAYDPASDRPAGSFGIDVEASALAAGAGAIWIADYGQGLVEEVDPQSGHDLGTTRVGAGPAAIAVGDGAVWVANSLDNTVSRIDAASGKPGPAISVGNDPVALAASGRSVWVANEYGSAVSRIDTRRNGVVQTTAIGGGPTTLAAAAGRIWVGTTALGAHRGGTLRLLFGRPLSQDTALQVNLPPPQSDGLTNDALFTFARVGVSQQLVPDLAVSVPPPANGAKTWTFRLRRERYSDGRLVQPEDFRRAIERVFRVRAPWSFLYTEIVGAGACSAHRCDLSRGILVDDAHRTITFRLASSDPGFPGKLAAPVSAPVPPGTPWYDVGYTPIPGTGPYMVATANAHEIRYVRNPHFHEWSHAAQPDGNPDVIVMRYGLSPVQEAREIEQDKADWSADGVPGSLLPEIVRRFPGQWHSLLQPDTEWLQLNTTIPPFNDLRVRQALSLAIDRAAIVRMYGGRLTATPTCQLIPPGLAGYQRYCPYTAGRADGRWHAPDLARARALVAASGTRGDPITLDGWVGGSQACPQLMPYTARLLRELGYRAEAHIIPPLKIHKVDWSAVQIGCNSSADFQPADFLGNLGCNAGPWFCDRRFDADVQRARTLERTNPHAANELLTKLDREATDRAIALPLVNLHFYDFVSARVKSPPPEDPAFGLVVDQASLR